MKKICFLILVVLLAQCKKEKALDRCACPENSICTMEFVALMVKVKDNEGNPVALDSYYTIHSSRQDTLYANPYNGYIDSMYKAEGSYPVLSDQYLGYTQKCGSEFEFVGLKDRQEIVRKSFHIGNNCCHVEWQGEHDDIVMDE